MSWFPQWKKACILCVCVVVFFCFRFVLFCFPFPLNLTMILVLTFSALLLLRVYGAFVTISHTGRTEFQPTELAVTLLGSPPCDSYVFSVSHLSALTIRRCCLDVLYLFIHSLKLSDKLLKLTSWVAKRNADFTTSKTHLYPCCDCLFNILRVQWDDNKAYHSLEKVWKNV